MNHWNQVIYENGNLVPAETKYHRNRNRRFTLSAASSEPEGPRCSSSRRSGMDSIRAGA